MNGVVDNALRTGLQAYGRLTMRPGASYVARVSPSSSDSPQPGLKRTGFSLRLGKFSISYQAVEPDAQTLLGVAQELVRQRQAGAFLSEMEIASLRSALFDPDHPDASAPGTGIMRRSGIDAYAHAAQSLEDDAGPRRTLIGVV